MSAIAPPPRAPEAVDARRAGARRRDRDPIAPRLAPARGAPDAEAAYAAAEDLMRAGSAAPRASALLDLVAAHPGDPRAELALLDLARLALAAGHPVEARGYLKRLLAATNDAALVDLGRQHPAPHRRRRGSLSPPLRG